MKKNLFKSWSLVAAVVMMGAMFASCGGSSESNAVKDAISEAEASIPLEESPVFGKLPSLYAQKLEAGTVLGKKFRELKTEDMSEAAKNKQKRDEAEKEMAAIYKEKFAEAMNGLDGKTIKVEFDESQISAATATLKITDKERAYFNLVFDVTMAKPINKQVRFEWEYRDAANKNLDGGSDYITPNEKFNVEYMVTANKFYSKTFDHVYIKF